MAWLTGWNRRKPKLVIGSTADAQIDYQLKLTIYKGAGADTDNTIYLGGYVNNDFSDLRFTSSDETTLLPYWIDSYISGVSAVVWVKIDSIPVDPLTKTIYIYYDNPVASPGSNGFQTFDLFDDFEDGVFDTNKWQISGGVTTESGGELTYNLSTAGYYYLTSKALFPDKRILQYESKATNYAGGWHYLAGFLENGDGTGHNIFFSYPYNTPKQLYAWDGVPGSITINNDWPNYHKMVMTRKYPDVSGYQDGTLLGTLSSHVSNRNLRVCFGGDLVKHFIRYVLLRKYASPEPIWSTTSPEQIYTANLTVSSTPSGAEIWINNIDQGVTTTRWFVLNPGTYTIMLTKPGYNDYIETITLSSNQNAIVQGNLIPTTGNVSFSSTPSGAEIFLAPTGSPLVDQGIVTPKTISLSPLTYDYKLTHIDYYDATGSFTITSGYTTILNIPLTPLPCPIVPKYSGNTITLNATPKDGIGPYYVVFSKNSVIIDPSRLQSLPNPILSAPENTLITRIYTLDDLDISSASTGTIDFSVFISDSCPTTPQNCTDTCTITIGCIAPVCNFTVT